nr:LysR family transcriptional regulator [Acetobacter conturbans]
MQAFTEVASSGSFSAAARKLGRAQSAISTHVSNLETDLGIALFSREGRLPVLTEAGQRLLEEARVVLDRRDHLVGVARSFEEGVENRLVVAIDELYPEMALGPVFQDFASQFPHVELELLLPLMEDVGDMVRLGSADLGVMWQQEKPPADLDFRTIGRVPLRLVCGRNHPLANAPVEWEDLKQHRQILVASRGRKPDRQQLRIAAEVWWVESNWVILEMVKHGVGWAFVSEHVLATSPTAPFIVTPELLFDAGHPQVPLSVVWDREKPHGPAARWLRQRLCEEKSPYILSGE